MKKAVIVSTTIICFIALVICNPGLVHPETAIPSTGNTGAPGEQTCARSGCHVGTALNLSQTAFTLDSLGSTNPITSGYIPNTEHSMSITLHLGHSNSGFQITALDQNNNAAGTFIKTNLSHTEVTQQGNRQYLSHKNATGDNGWAFKWRAPLTDIGPVTFYFTGCGADGDNTEAGDVIYLGAAQVTTSSFTRLNVTGIKPIDADDEASTVNIFPNPISENLNVEFYLHSENQVTIELFDVSGKVVKRFDEYVQSPGFHRRSFSFEDKLNEGIYLLKLTEGERVYFKKLMATN